MGQTLEQGQDVLAAVEQSIEAVTQSPDLLRRMKYPDVASDKLELLNLFLKEAGWSEEQRLRVCTAAAFAQIGMDIHEQVNAEHGLGEQEKRQRQLSILAGDFFSSQFYAMLAECGEIQIISLIAQAIMEINEAKMRLYQSKQDAGFQDLLQEYTIIHSALYSKLTTLDEQRGPWWKMIMERMIVTELATHGPMGPDERAVFTCPEWEKLLSHWLNDMERLIQQATNDDETAARLRQRFFYVQKRFSKMSTEVQG